MIILSLFSNEEFVSALISFLNEARKKKEKWGLGFWERRIASTEGGSIWPTLLDLWIEVQPSLEPTIQAARLNRLVLETPIYVCHVSCKEHASPSQARDYTCAWEASMHVVDMWTRMSASFLPVCPCQFFASILIPTLILLELRPTRKFLIFLKLLTC